MTYGAGVLVLGHGRISHGENAICFFKIVISIPRLDSHKLSTCTGLVYSNDNEERVYLNCKFHDPWVWGSCATAWPYRSYCDFLKFSTPRHRSDKLRKMFSNNDPPGRGSCARAWP